MTTAPDGGQQLPLRRKSHRLLDIREAVGPFDAASLIFPWRHADLRVDALQASVMALAGALGVLGVPLPGVEIGIALSAIALGSMVAFAAKPPLWIAAVLVGAFAIFHGHAHGAELPVGADAVAFSIGFVAATGLLHLSGITFGALSQWAAGRMAVQAAGAVIALIGVYYLVRAL